MALFLNSPPQYFGLSRPNYIKKIDLIPDGITLIITYDFASLVLIDDLNIKNIKLNGRNFSFGSKTIRTILLKEDDSLEIFYTNPITLKQNLYTIPSIKLSHLDSNLCPRELGIA